jgi:hypothetical protein
MWIRPSAAFVLLLFATVGSLAPAAQQPDKPSAPAAASAEEWMDRWIAAKTARMPVGALHLARFKDPIYVLMTPIGWKPNPDEAARLNAVEVPKGFVTDFASIPQVFWSALRPDGDYAYAAVIHDYLYWAQTTTREQADEIFRIAMAEFGIDITVAFTIHTAVRFGGEQAWRQNAQLKANGEKRILKTLPEDPRITWPEWKARPGVFE